MWCSDARPVVYRTGLPLRSCITLRDALAPHTADLAKAFADPVTDYLELLARFVATIAPEVQELQTLGWSDLNRDDLGAATADWLDGSATEEELHVSWPDIWPALSVASESLLPWILTAAVEIAVLAQRDVAKPVLDLSVDTIHGRLGISRLRYGVPHPALCDVVREGVARSDACRLAAEFARLDPMDQLISGGVAESVRTRLEAEDEAAQTGSEDDPFEQADSV